MRDIFLNYFEEDWEMAAALVTIFIQQKWTVDEFRTPLGAYPLRDVADEIKAAKVVVVLWSRGARESSFMLRALEYVGSDYLIPILVEEIELPRKVSRPLPYNLTNWDGAESHPELQRLLRHIRGLIAAQLPTAKPPASFEELSLSKIRENARVGIKESAETRPGGETQFSGIFISYRRSEAAAYARGLYGQLGAHFGRDKVFLDLKNIDPGEDFVEAITSAAESCEVMIVLVSRGWARGAGGQEGADYVRLEVAKALGRKIRVIPILIQDAAMPAPKELPEDLAPLVRRNALALSDTRWDRDVEDLIKSLETLL